MLKKQLSVLYLFLASSTFHLASSLFLHAELHEEGNQRERGEGEREHDGGRSFSAPPFCLGVKSLPWF